jgi:hypothetical protein
MYQTTKTERFDKNKIKSCRCGSMEGVNGGNYPLKKAKKKLCSGVCIVNDDIKF